MGEQSDARRRIEEAERAMENQLQNLRRQIDEGERLHRAELEALLRTDKEQGEAKLREFDAAMAEIRATLVTIKREARAELESIRRDEG